VVSITVQNLIMIDAVVLIIRTFQYLAHLAGKSLLIKVVVLLMFICCYQLVLVNKDIQYRIRTGNCIGESDGTESARNRVRNALKLVLYIASDGGSHVVLSQHMLPSFSL